MRPTALAMEPMASAPTPGIRLSPPNTGTLKKKLDYNMPPYRILGACNPAFAKRALAAEPSIGLLLPCNVVVRQDAAGTVQVEFLDPGMMGQMTGNPDVGPIGKEVREKLQKVMRAL